MAVILGDNTYYVSSSTTDDCPQPCHPLSYYTTDTDAYFTSNVTFNFMEGEHLLDSKGLVQVIIDNADNLTLRGKRGHTDIETIIKCSSNTRGLVIYNGSIVTIYGIIITGCGQQDISPLLFSNITSLYIHHITLYNNVHNTSDIGGTMYIHCVTDIHLANSEFTNNILGGNGGGLYILYSRSDTDIHSNLTITNSVFTNNTIGGNGGGLYIYSDNDINNNLTITNSAFTNNTVGGYGGGLRIYSDTNIHNSITIANGTFTNNKVGCYGGGLFIYFEIDIHNNIAITNSTFENNIAAKNGGGMLVHSGIDIHNNITITNSAFTNNIVGGDGGGLLLFFYTRIHNNIIITNSAFNNNTAVWYGGGLRIYSDSDIHYTTKYKENSFHK